LFVEADGGITGDYAECIYAVPDDFADFDDDGDEDLSDIAAFQNGVGLSGAGLEPGCIRAEWEDNWNSSGLDLQRPIFPAV
jgi:hypothetical protein